MGERGEGGERGGEGEVGRELATLSIPWLATTPESDQAVAAPPFLYCVYTMQPNHTGAVRHGTVRQNRRV